MLSLRGTAPDLDPTFREGDGNGGIIRSPLRAIALPDNMRWERSSIRYTRRTFWDSRMGFGLGATRMAR